jgi:hypothetical protein
MSNETTTTPTAAEAVTGTALLTLDPEQYVAAVFGTFRERLEAAKAAAAAVKVVDVTTAEGMRTAITHRATFRAIRVEAEKARQMRKKPILEIGRLLDSRAKELEAEITPLEERFDGAIKAEEARKEAEKAAAAERERERVENIQAGIRAIRGALIDVAGRSAETIARAIAELSAQEITKETAHEFLAEAEAARDQTVAKLRDMHAAQLRAEEEAARIKAEREALERERAERAEQAERERVERERQAAERRQQEQAAAAERARIAAEERAARERIEAQEREARERREAEERRIQEERERVAAEARALEERQREARRAEEERERQERVAQEQREREEREAKEAAARAEREAAEAEAREARRRELELADIRHAFAVLRERVNGMDEFAWFAKAYDAQKTSKPTRRKAA